MSPVPGAVAVMLALLVVFAAVCASVQSIRAHRAERQVEDERRMHRGFAAARRLGWLRDDVQ